MTLRDGMGREMGGGVQDAGTHVYPWLISVDVWQKPSQYCKVSPIKINKLIKKKRNKKCPLTIELGIMFIHA